MNVTLPERSVTTTPSTRLFRMASSVALFSSSWRKESSSLSAMELKVRASTPSSSSKPGLMRLEKSPLPISRAPREIRSTRRPRRVAKRSARPPPSTEATTAASIPLRKKSWYKMSSESPGAKITPPARSPSRTTGTIATLCSPILSLIRSPSAAR
jgi:hypothetical protein